MDDQVAHRLAGHDILRVYDASSLYQSSKALVQIFHNDTCKKSFCKIFNLLSKKLLAEDNSLLGWHKTDTNSRVYISQLGRLKLGTVYGGEHIMYFSIQYIEVYEFGYNQLIEPHLDRLAAYSSERWSLEELQKYAEDEWQIKGNNRAEIIALIKEYINSDDWVASLKQLEK